MKLKDVAVVYSNRVKFAMVPLVYSGAEGQAVRSCFVHLLFCSNRAKFAMVPPEQVPAPSLLRLRRRLLPFTKPWVAMPANLPYYYSVC